MQAGNELNGKIIHQIHRIGRMQHRRHGGPRGRGRMDATRGQGRVLALLKLKDEFNQKDIAFLLGMRQQSVAELLVKLEEKGLIEREHSDEDKRQMIVKLTEAGTQAAEELGQSSKASFIDCLEEEEKKTLSDYLDRIIAKLEEEMGEEWEAMEEERRRHFEEMFDGRPPEDFNDFNHPWGHGPGGHGPHGKPCGHSGHPHGPHRHHGERGHHGGPRCHGGYGRHGHHGGHPCRDYREWF